MESSRARVGIGEEDLASEHVALMQALGATDHAICRGLLDGIADAAKDAGRVTDESVDFVASVVAGIAPPR